jgi:Family of unknown function (DUF5994)
MASVVRRTRPFRDCVIADSNYWLLRRQGQERRMTLQRGRNALGREPAPPDHTPRLRLKPKAPTSGYVDGAWWPNSDDLPTELPDLLAVLSVRLGPIDRVLYNLAKWVQPPKKLPIDGHVVRLAGYNRQPSNTIEVLGRNRNKIVLLVVPWSTDPDDAHHTMMAAAAPDGTTTVERLLKPGEGMQRR